jgi:hypothetical protein
MHLRVGNAIKSARNTLLSIPLHEAWIPSQIASLIPVDGEGVDTLDGAGSWALLTAIRRAEYDLVFELVSVGAFVHRDGIIVTPFLAAHEQCDRLLIKSLASVQIVS